MTFEKLYDKWARNINSEYLLPTLDSFKESNFIISKNTTKEEMLKELKKIKEIVKGKE